MNAVEVIQLALKIPRVSSRLLDLDTFDASQDLRLVTAPYVTGENLVYVTLSHCWGAATKRPMITTTTTLEQRFDKIPFGELPLTFKDAVQITRSVGMRYL